MDNLMLAQTILQGVGGAKNVIGSSYCATGISFTLKECSEVTKTPLLACPSISDIQEKASQCQIVIVHDQMVQLYQHITHLIALECTAEINHDSKSKETLMATVFSVVSGSFTPLLGVLAGSGMIKALLSVLLMLHWIDAASSTYLVLSAASNAVFYFLPILLGVSAAIKMGANAYLGGAIGAALLEPNFTGLIKQTETTLLGFSFEAMNYSATVFPIFLAVLMLAGVEKVLTRYCPNNVQFFLVPMLCLLVVVPVTVTVFGPFGMYVGSLIATGINLLMGLSGLLTGAFIGGIMMFLVVFGLHWAVIPVVIANLATGWDPIMAMWIPSSFAQMGVALAIYLLSKDSNLRLLAGPATATGLLAGVTEPIIYGLIMRYRRTIPYVVIAGAIGGAINGFFQVKLNAFVFHNIFSIAAFNPMLYALIGITSGFFLAFIMTLLFGFESKKDKQQHEQNNNTPAMA